MRLKLDFASPARSKYSLKFIDQVGVGLGGLQGAVTEEAADRRKPHPVGQKVRSDRVAQAV
jgi:hypothetical protein